MQKRHPIAKFKIIIKTVMSKANVNERQIFWMYIVHVKWPTHVGYVYLKPELT
jgi:hypothetical protein